MRMSKQPRSRVSALAIAVATGATMFHGDDRHRLQRFLEPEEPEEREEPEEPEER